MLDEQPNGSGFVLWTLRHRVQGRPGELIGVCFWEMKGEEERVGGCSCGVFDRHGNLTPAALHGDDVAVLDFLAFRILRVDFKEVA